ncbi:FecR family protein [Aquimarina megaterium]|uniref:FecR family protein n=1 Tax=Aquimarina megaterium TaxID=1443666 RepID=UPI000472BBBD|nr:FecR domain-containing protein [Aquimarina megaterium]
MEQDQITEVDIWGYISKSADIATNERVEEWMNSDDFNENLFNKIQNIYNATGEKIPKHSDLETNVAKQKFFNSIENKERKNSSWKKIIKYAAMAAILVSTAVYTYQIIIANDIISIETAYSDHEQIHLPDGSVVWLNSSSKLSYNPKSPRTLFLDGEAFFEVAKDKEHPFTVETPDHIIVKALGTSFNVKSYAKNTFTETVLLTGKVEMSSKEYLKNSIIMLPNDKVKIFKNDGRVLASKSSNAISSIAWREGKIQFNNKPFLEIANDLKIQHNVNIRFENEQISHSKFTGSFDQDLPINDILEVLKASKNFKYEYNTKTNEWVIK